MGGWCHPEISLQELLKLIKGFVDIIILASGYQSSGHFAHWDPLNIKKAFQWGLFFENVFISMDGNQDSINEFDAALSKLTSDPQFPQGLTRISSATLSKSRIFIVEHLIRTLPMRDTHLKAVLKATIEMDLDELQRTETNYVDIYLEKLTLQKRSQVSIEEGLMDFLPFSCFDDILHQKAKNSTEIKLTAFAIRGIMKRQRAVSCASMMETSVDVVAKITTQGNWNELHEDLLQVQQNHSTVSLWNNWRTRTLSYLLDKRTIRLVSGANMIFSAPKVQWARVFKQLDMSKEANENACETIELLLLGSISSRWDRVIQKFMSNSHGSISIFTLYEGVHNLILERFQKVKLLRGFGASTSFMY
ncbi:hypothetical protein Ccrd_009233 [Cynara cardunculus var. scolymus]|uniref:Uncharacterized protein n=1 Tax=Cynara cardunculus var. scolymus TaxID=59895 RepID=A0A118K7K4_CYNCS|nr:hypothetical protein Ccrd_009233 [Cynara cardunculus var. scolymus]